MDDVQQRLTETVKTTLESYEAWSKDKSKDETREALNEAVHELRKVASRVEIEIAVSERDEQSRNPIPIPPHRSKKPGNGDSSDILEDHGHTHEKPKRGNGGRSNNRQGGRPRRKPNNGNGDK